MGINSKYIVPKFKKDFNPKIGLITLSSDHTMESDFVSVCKDLPINIFVNRINNYNPLTKENLLKDEIIENVAEKILTQEKTVAVLDNNNKIVGSINPTKIINTVFGGRKNSN